VGEYFWQDQFVARGVIDQNPPWHIDVGSRIDSFITYLAWVRKVEIFDICPLGSTFENVEFTRWNITEQNTDFMVWQPVIFVCMR